MEIGDVTLMSKDISNLISKFVDQGLDRENTISALLGICSGQLASTMGENKARKQVLNWISSPVEAANESLTKPNTAVGCYTASAEAIKLYETEITKLVEGSHIWKKTCDDKLEEILQCFDPMVRTHVYKMKTSSWLEYIEWSQYQE